MKWSNTSQFGGDVNLGLPVKWEQRATIGSIQSDVHSVNDAVKFLKRHHLVNWYVDHVVDEKLGLVRLMHDKRLEVVQVAIFWLHDIQLCGTTIGINSHCVESFEDLIRIFLSEKIIVTTTKSSRKTTK